MAEKDQRQIDREAELKRQDNQRQAVQAATHDKSGKPTPIVPPEVELPQLPGVRTFGGKKP